MHEWREHTAEIELVIDAGSEAAVFEEAAIALGELIEASGAHAPAMRAISVSAPDRGALLVDWLQELVYLADTQSFAARAARVLVEGDSARGEVDGVVGAVAPLVKAATYHALSYEERGGRWHARVVLDV